MANEIPGDQKNDNISKKPNPLQTNPVKLRVLKGLGVVVLANLVLVLANTFFLYQFLPEQVLRNNFYPQSTIFLYQLFYLGISVGLWAFRSGFAMVISKYGFKSKGGFRDILYGYGIAHFPVVLSAIGVLCLFLGNIGFFLAFFFGMLSFLLVYLYFGHVLMRYHNLDWKKAVVTILIIEVIIFGLQYLVSNISVANTSMDMMTRIVTLS